MYWNKIITKINHNTFIKSEELQKVLKLPIHVKIIGNGESLDENIEKFMFYPFITSKVNSEGLGLTYVNSILSSFGGIWNMKKKEIYPLLIFFFLSIITGDNY